MPTTRPSHPASPARRKRDRRGAAAVEFALVMLPLLTLLLGAIQFGWFFYTSQSTSSAARETARRLVVGDCTGSAATAYASGQANVLNLSLSYGTPTADPNDKYGLATTGSLPTVGNPLRVVVSADSRIINFIPGMPSRITRVVNARMENDTASLTC